MASKLLFTIQLVQTAHVDILFELYIKQNTSGHRFFPSAPYNPTSLTSAPEIVLQEVSDLTLVSRSLLNLKKN